MKFLSTFPFTILFYLGYFDVDGMRPINLCVVNGETMRHVSIHRDKLFPSWSGFRWVFALPNIILATTWKKNPFYSPLHVNTTHFHIWINDKWMTFWLTSIISSSLIHSQATNTKPYTFIIIRQQAIYCTLFIHIQIHT